MRRSSVVKLTLLPLLASTAIAAADIVADPPPMQPMSPVATPPIDREWNGADGPSTRESNAGASYAGPPGMAVPELSPPGMTPTIDELDCEDDPNWELRDDCRPEYGYTAVYRGGFGHYFWSGGG